MSPTFIKNFFKSKLGQVKKTNRGFEYIVFDDRYGHACSMQASSLADERAIWLGVENPNPRVEVCRDGCLFSAKRAGPDTEPAVSCRCEPRAIPDHPFLPCHVKIPSGRLGLQSWQWHSVPHTIDTA